jgi:hypothetical protein
VLNDGTGPTLGSGTWVGHTNSKNSHPVPARNAGTSVGLFFCIGEFATGLQQLLRGGSLLIGRDERVGYEGFVTGWSGVLG